MAKAFSRSRDPVPFAAFQPSDAGLDHPTGRATGRRVRQNHVSNSTAGTNCSVPVARQRIRQVAFSSICSASGLNSYVNIATYLAPRDTSETGLFRTTGGTEAESLSA